MIRALINIFIGLAIVVGISYGVFQRFQCMAEQELQKKNTFLAIEQQSGAPVTVFTLTKKNLITRSQITAVPQKGQLKAWIERRHLAKIAVGQKWRGITANGPSQISGIIKSVQRQADLDTGLFIVQLEQQAGPSHNAGAFAVEVDTGLIQDALVVPIQVIRLENGAPHLTIAKDGKASLIPINIGSFNNSEAVISGPIAAGDQVIYKGSHSVSNGARIHIVSLATAAEGNDQ